MDKEFKGTNGEWNFQIFENENLFFPIITKKDGDRIVTYLGIKDKTDVEKEEFKANAKLISAAPELLSLIQDLIYMESIVHISLHKKAVDLLNTILE